MSAQVGETLIYNGERFAMHTEPLGYYLKTRPEIDFYYNLSICIRGYHGTWEIRENKLFLISLKAGLRNGEIVGLSYLFPEEEAVFAGWFSGEIRLPVGEQLVYVHMAYASLFEKDIILRFENGVLVDEKIIDNTEEFNKRKEQARVEKEKRLNALTVSKQRKNFWQKWFGKS